MSNLKLSDDLINMLINIDKDISNEGRKECTIRFYYALNVLGKQNQFVTYCHGINKEWLWDLIWSKEASGKRGWQDFTGLPLTCEIEWDRDWNKLLEDFQKLFVAKSDIKLFVCQGCNDFSRDNHLLMENLRQKLSFFDERYRNPGEHWIVYISAEKYCYQEWEVTKDRGVRVLYKSD